ncbi:MAG TPA: alkaline phosphatase family protein [Jatrophihabitantaceae bacterium]|jgi:phospholipase C
MGGAAGAAVAAGLLSALPEAGAATPSRNRGQLKGRLEDVGHGVILRQENRSVDHYYGTVRGVRGYADSVALRGVFRQPDPARPDGGILLPWRVDTSTVDGQDLGGNDHSWDGVQQQWTGGNLNGWIADTGEGTMVSFTKDDVPSSGRWPRRRCTSRPGAARSPAT